MFELMFLTFSGYNNNHLEDLAFLSDYKKKVNFYSELLETYEKYL